MKTWFVIHGLFRGGDRIVDTLKNVTLVEAVAKAAEWGRKTGNGTYVRPLNRPARVRG